MFFEAAWESVRPGGEAAILEGHTDLVHDVCAFETSGAARLASVGRDATVRIWDPASRRQTHVLRGHTGDVVRVLAVGGSLVSAGEDATVRVWDQATGRLIRMLTGHRGVAEVRVDGRTLIASATDGVVVLWHPDGGRSGPAIADADIELEAFCSGGRMQLAGKSASGGLAVWDYATGERRWHRQPDARSTAGVCPIDVADRCLVASAGFDQELDPGRIRLWDSAGGALERTIEFAPTLDRVLDRITGVRRLEVAGRQVLMAVGQKTVRVWDPVDAEPLRVFTAPDSWVECCAVIQLGGRPTVAVSERYQGTIWLWDLETGEPVTSLHGESSPVTALCAIQLADTRPPREPRADAPKHGDRTFLASADGTGRTVRVWDPLRGPVRTRRGGHTREVYGVRRAGDRIMSFGFDSARIWSAATGARLHTCRGFMLGIVDAADLVLDERTVIAAAFSVYDSGAVRIWDPGTGRLVRRLARRWEEGPSVLCPFTCEGRVLLAAGDEYDVRVWDPAAGTLEQETSCGDGVSWLGRVVVGDRPVMVGRGDEGVRIWDPRTAAWEPTGARSGTYAFMADGRPLVAEAEKAGTVHVRDLLSGETCYSLRGHTGYWIEGIGTMTVGGREYLATAGGADRTARLWDASTGACVLTIPVHREVVGCADAGGGILAVAVPAGVLAYRLTA